MNEVIRSTITGHPVTGATIRVFVIEHASSPRFSVGSRWETFQSFDCLGPAIKFFEDFVADNSLTNSRPKDGATENNMNAEIAFTQIAEMISYTNNGKLMLMRIPPALREFVPALVAEGRLIRAGFMQAGDAVRLS